MREAVIVAYARTPIGKAYRGAFNNTHGATLAGSAIAAALARAGVEPAEVEDVVLGCGLPEGATGDNIARQAALRAGLPVTTAGFTVSRFCASGLQAIAVAAHQIVTGDADVVIAGGVESISLVENSHRNLHFREDPWIAQHYSPIYRMSMIDTAEVVAQRYGISRERQDAYALQSQERNGKAVSEGLIAREIEPIQVIRSYPSATEKGGEPAFATELVTADEGPRPQSTLAGLAALRTVTGPDGCVTAGNASQMSDGAAALVLMDRVTAERRGVVALGAFRSLAVAGCDPDEMGVGPAFAVPKLLRRNGLTVDDIDLWELNEAFASQVLYCQDKLGIPNERFNIDGGAISLGHPYGMSGARMAGHALMRGHDLGARRAVVTMCIGHGMGAAGLFEVF